MYWTFAGYLTALYCAFGVLALIELPDHPSPLAGAMAIFIWLPLVVGTLSLKSLGALSKEDEAAIRAAFCSGAITRRRAYVAGFVNGCAAIVLLVLVWLPSYFTDSGGSLWVGILGSLIVLSFAPALGFAWLSAKARSAEQEAPNQSLQPPSRGSAPPSG